MPNYLILQQFHYGELTSTRLGGAASFWDLAVEGLQVRDRRVGMLRIGYVREVDAASHQDSALLEAAGCQVVRHEATGSDGAVLDSILEFIGPGDQLVVQRLDRLSGSGRGLLRVLDALEARGAGLQVLTPWLASQGAAGRALRAAVEAVAGLEPTTPVRGHRAAATQAIVALRNQGLGPVEIARRLGVSRMTIWRRLRNLKSTEA